MQCGAADALLFDTLPLIVLLHVERDRPAAKGIRLCSFSMPTVEHIVLLQFKEGTPAAKIDELQAAVEALVHKIPVALSVTVGPTFTTERAHGFTHALIVRLPDKVRPAAPPTPAQQQMLTRAPTATFLGLASAVREPPRARGGCHDAHQAHSGEATRRGLRDGRGGGAAAELYARRCGGGRGGGDAAVTRAEAVRRHAPRVVLDNS